MSSLTAINNEKGFTISAEASQCISILEEQCAPAGISLNRAQLLQFGIYYDLLTETNKVMNLTALTSPHDVAVKHYIDSLLCYDAALMKGKTVIDVGTGAGFPGIPLKIYEPSIQIVLLDSLAKRLRFLQDAVERLGLPAVRFEHKRAEDAGRDTSMRARYDVAVSRAVARLSVLAELCLPLVKKSGFFIALKGIKYKEEIEEAKNAISVLGGKLTSARKVELPGQDETRVIIVIRKIKETPAAYPRKAGLPGKKPLR